MSDRAEKLAIIAASVALLAVLCFKGKVSWHAQADRTSPTAELQHDTDEMIVGDSGPAFGNPVSPRLFANTRYVACLPGMPAPLRQSTRGPMIEAQVLNG